MSSATDPLVAEIVESLRLRYLNINPYYEAGWTESWSHRRCLHKHYALPAAATWAMPQGAGWYVFAAENGHPRQLDEAEENIVNNFRFTAAALNQRNKPTPFDSQPVPLNSAVTPISYFLATS